MRRGEWSTASIIDITGRFILRHYFVILKASWPFVRVVRRLSQRLYTVLIPHSFQHSFCFSKWWFRVYSKSGRDEISLRMTTKENASQLRAGSQSLGVSSYDQDPNPANNGRLLDYLPRLEANSGIVWPRLKSPERKARAFPENFTKHINKIEYIQWVNLSYLDLNNFWRNVGSFSEIDTNLKFPSRAVMLSTPLIEKVSAGLIFSPPFVCGVACTAHAILI